jgi:transcriptional regulator
MYVPAHFREENLSILHNFIKEHNFGILVTQYEGVPFATHLPFVFYPERGPHGTLVAHMARANPHWRSFTPDSEALVIFSGPHAYISPSWYEVELSVPTWNYAAVHVYGYPRLIEDPQVLYSELKALIETHESQFEHPWPFALPADYTEKMMRGTVGFTLEITRIEGKFKLSQNRTPSERARVIAALETTHPDVAQLMKEREQSS